MSSEDSLRREMSDACRRIALQGLAPGTSGNVSTRLGRTALLITPSGRALGEVRPGDLVKVRLRGGTTIRGRPSSELSAHLSVYRARQDVRAVVHAHPPACMGFAMARKDFGRPCNLEAYVVLGEPALVPFAPTGEWGELLGPYLEKADCFLLANHGALTVGGSLREAEHRLEVMENFARGLLAARLLGGPVPFTRAELASIRRFMERSGLPPPPSAARRAAPRTPPR